MDVYVLPKFSKSNSKTVKIAQEILLTKVSHLVESIEVDYEKSDLIVNLSQELLEKRNCTIDEVAEALVGTKRTITKKESSNNRKKHFKEIYSEYSGQVFPYSESSSAEETTVMKLLSECHFR